MAALQDAGLGYRDVPKAVAAFEVFGDFLSPQGRLADRQSPLGPRFQDLTRRLPPALISCRWQGPYPSLLTSSRVARRAELSRRVAADAKSPPGIRRRPWGFRAD